MAERRDRSGTPALRMTAETQSQSASISSGVRRTTDTGTLRGMVLAGMVSSWCHIKPTERDVRGSQPAYAPLTVLPVGQCYLRCRAPAANVEYEANGNQKAVGLLVRPDGVGTCCLQGDCITGWGGM